jgi:transcriptional regulator with XRE-family HTH domain
VRNPLDFGEKRTFVHFRNLRQVILSNASFSVHFWKEQGMPRKAPDPIDKLVGRNIRIQRLKKGLSQKKLGDALGLTFQQVQKYEKGTNRVGSGRLYKIASIFGIPVVALFEGTDASSGSNESILDLLAEPYSLRLIQAVSEITDSELRRSLVELVERIAADHTSRSGVRRPAGSGRA